MKKLLLVLLAFLAVFTYLRTFNVAEAEEIHTEAQSAEVSRLVKPVEISR
ncbi:MAG: hypothetical protein FWD40_01615 [Treponema sp.]|nr:hypothetical protein [Treponema sp.]